MLAFIFNPMVIGHTLHRIGVFRRKGGSPSSTATVMVEWFWVGISTEIHIGSCTAQGYVREN